MEHKLRICLAILGDINKEQIWSGTSNVLYEKFSSRDDVELTLLNYEIKDIPQYKYYQRIRKYIFTWNSAQDLFIRKSYIQMFKESLKNIDVNKIDVFFFPAFVCPIEARQNIQSKIVLYTDCLMSDLNRYRPYKPLKLFSSYFYKIKVKKDLKVIDLLFTQNDWSARRFKEFCHISKESIFNVHFGVNLKPYEGEKDYGNNMLLIVLRKGNERIKGLKLLLNAFPLVKKRIPTVKLCVVGTDYGENVEGVTCYFNQPRTITENLFKKSSLYVMPSHREPNGITYLEALANKVPVVGLNRFAFPEFSGYGQWGFLQDKEDPESLADTICFALSDIDRLRLMGIKGQQFVMNNFLWNNTIERMINIMKNKFE